MTSKIFSRSGAWELLNTLTASNSATLSDTTSFTSAFNEYELVFENIVPATASVALGLQVHSGGSFQTGAIYSYAIGGTNVAGSATAAGSAVGTSVLLSDGSNITNSSPGCAGRIRISNPSSASIMHMWEGHMGRQTAQYGIIGWWGSAAAIDGFQILFSSGNITSGTVKVYGRM